MTDQLFIEHALKVAGIELDKQANATVSGEWYFWFSPFVHSKQMESIIEFFDFAANPDTSESTLFWTNYALSLDLFLTMNMPIRGSVDTSFGFSKIGDKHAHIQIVRNSCGFVAVRIQHLKTGSEQRQASLQVRAELMYLLQLYSVRCHKKKSEDIGWENAHRLWVERGMAKAFAELYDEDLTAEQIYEKIIKACKK